MHAHRLLASLLFCLGLLSSGTAMSETIQVSVDGKSYPIEMADNRSEERRVGKECRSRWSPYH